MLTVTAVGKMAPVSRSHSFPATVGVVKVGCVP